MYDETQTFISVEVRSMIYFSEPVTAIYLRDVSKLVSNHILKNKNQQEKRNIKNIKYSNENVAHEMRSPIGSIITMIGILIGDTRTNRLEPLKIRQYQCSIRK